MRYEFITPFIDSTVRVLDSVLQVDVSKGDVALAEGYDIEGEISILINLKGDTDGCIVVNMDSETAINVYNAMSMDNSEELTELELDGIMELANIIAGNAISVLNEKGFDFDVSPPVIVTRGQLAPKKDKRMEVFLIPLFTECGEIIMNISMRTH